jgi:hypothetical protein
LFDFVRLYCMFHKIAAGQDGPDPPQGPGDIVKIPPQLVSRSADLGCQRFDAIFGLYLLLHSFPGVQKPR